ncbi:hypothetical protein ACFW1M_34735 [Streptomyces inhibens]|uniref:hypothetical protein n=1 Tax=Streptomyces inhibens TaxID=2293571 RepID=UPI0036B27913
MTRREAATHGVPAESRDMLDCTHALVRFHADGELQPAIDMLPDVLSGPSGTETFRHRQTVPKGGVTSWLGLIPAPAG